MHTVGIILAGGLGIRMGANKPKQLLLLDNKPIVIHSLEAFNKHPLINEIILVVNRQFKADFEQLLASYSFSKLSTITCGGTTRSASSYNGLQQLSIEKESKVLIHDAVRPFVSQEIISRVVSALDTYKAVNVGIAATDTIIITNERHEIKTIPPRANIVLAQTPQGFLSTTIRKAYKQAFSSNTFTATDDCGVVNRYCPDIPIGIVEGELENKKITYPSDL